MDDNSKARLQITSIVELPIDVLFRVFSHLEFSDLKNVSATCWTLRVLSNEKLMYYSIFSDPNNQYMWTKRYLLDSLRFLDRRRHLFSMNMLNNTTIFQSLRYLHDRMMNVSKSIVKLIDYQDDLQLDEIECQDNNEGDEENTQNNENNDTEEDEEDEEKYEGENEEEETEEDSEEIAEHNGDLRFDPLEYEKTQSELEDDCEGSFFDDQEMLPIEIPKESYVDNYNSSFRSVSRTKIIDLDGRKYLEILEGFHKICTTPGKQTASRNNLSHIFATPTKQDEFLNTLQLTPLSSIHSLLKRIDSTADSNNANSPDSFGNSHSRSGSSVFSDDAPKLSDNPWSVIYDLEHASDYSSESDSSSSTDFIRELQSSKKVKDKAVLFERLLAKTKVKSSATNDRKVSAEDVNIISPQLYTKRKVSDKYLEELKRSNSPCSNNTPTQTLMDNKLQSLDGPNNMTVLPPTKLTKKLKTHHRRKLKASFCDGW